MDHRTIDRAAELLWRARAAGRRLEALPPECRPTSVDDGYAIQDRLVAHAGRAVLGWKLAVTSQAGQRRLGIEEPLAGRLLEGFVLADNARLNAGAMIMRVAVPEFAFRLGRDLPPRAEPYGRDDVVRAIDAVAGAVEVVGSRLEGGLSGKGRFLITADSGANIGLVVGRWTTDWRGLDLKAQPVAMHINGRLYGAGTGARALGDPLNVMVWLANRQSRGGRGLEKGICVSTGTCTGLDPVKPGDTAVADFGSLGKVEIAFA
jgi:2-keto-4-pentenoate hydratase